MTDQQRELQEALRIPQESLPRELKPWLDPSSPADRIVIAKACIALYNHDGGTLALGFNDDGSPAIGRPSNLRERYNNDIVQPIVMRFASQPIAVTVEFIEREGEEYPVICVPSGVRTPVCAKSDASDGSNSIKCDMVYVRTLDSNGKPSTAPAGRKDWDALVGRCFENREADIAEFARRHFTAENLKSMRNLLHPSACREVESGSPDTGTSPSTPTPAPSSPSGRDRAIAYLNAGHAAYEEAMARLGVTVPQAGFREVAAVIEGSVPTQDANQDFLQKIFADKPLHSGWTPWMDSRNASVPEDRPYLRSDADSGGLAWESAIVDLAMDAVWGQHLDFWRADPQGKFYHLRALEDDLRLPARQPRAMSQLEFVLQVSRVAECVSVVLSFARSLGCDEGLSTVGVACRWSGLSGRYLSSWANPDRGFVSRAPAVQDSITTAVVIPLGTPQTGIAPYVESLVRDLFLLFDGTRFQPSVLEAIVKDTLSKRY